MTEITPVPVTQFQVDWGIEGVILSLGQPRLNTSVTPVPVGFAFFSAISLSPSTAKQLRDIMVDAVRRYENSFGEIPMPALAIRSPDDAERKVIPLGAPKDPAA